MPIRQGCKLASRASTWPRDHFCRNTMLPRRSWPTRWNEFLPISIPITAISLSSFWDMACFLCLGCPGQLAFLAGLEHRSWPDETERLLAEINPDYGDFVIKFRGHAVLLCLRCPGPACFAGRVGARPDHPISRLGLVHSPLMFAALMMGHHFSIWAVWKARSASGVCCSRGGISCPNSASRERTVGWARAPPFCGT